MSSAADDPTYVTHAIREGLRKKPFDPVHLQAILRIQPEFLELVAGEKIKLPQLIEPDPKPTRESILSRVSTPSLAKSRLSSFIRTKPFTLLRLPLSSSSTFLEKVKD